MLKISVVIPIYNCETYLERCLKSVLSQSYDDYEVILVDDGSVDGSGLICDQYGQYHENVKVIHQENHGVSVARNQGVKSSTGQYISFVDADDWIPQNSLAVMASCASSRNADMVVSELYWYKDGDITTQTDDSKGAIHYYGNREAINVLGAEAGSRFKSASGKLIRRSIVEKIPFPEGRKVGEDTTCVYQWLYISNLIAVIDQPLYYYYRSNPNSATSDKNKYLPGVYETFDEMMEFFNTEGFPELVDKWSSKYSWAMASKCAFERSENYTTYSLLKKKLQHFIQEKNMSIRDYPYQYEVAYPFRSKVYWLMEGVKHKFKLQPKNQ